jgi:O-antigen/teichoic acid export membrane protein
VQANSVVVPVIAELKEKAPEKLRDVYIRAYETVFFLAVPVYAGLLLLLPLVSEVWIGHVESKFIVFAAILIGTYFLNNLEVPAYFDNLGTGELGWNSVAHFTMAALNAVLGVILGYFWGAVGVAIGASIALLVSSAMVLYVVNRKYKVPVEQLIPRDHRAIALVIVCVTIAGVAWLAWAEHRGLSLLVHTTMAVAVFVIAYVAIGWKHPYRFQIERSFRERSGKAAR